MWDSTTYRYLKMYRQSVYRRNTRNTNILEVFVREAKLKPEYSTALVYELMFNILLIKFNNHNQLKSGNTELKRTE